jgi:carbonic anhydrase
MGSVTTPPCPQTVAWIVFRTPIEASTNEISRYRAVFPMNARPLQPLNCRFILES